jgi:hypothetical protein
MLGDYVKVKPSGMIIKVAAIHQKKVGYHSCQSKLEWVRRDLIEPIPLTPEILEKNGFVKSEHVSDTPPYDKDELGNMHFSQNGRFWGWWQPHEVFMIPANGLGWLEIKYVHELQHAFKMSWIKKEIEL